ncbi:methyltransferase domain-containing protein [Streptacidiphilus anmyonensis]|uniref:methyltransferase domain-containing protein n=1 Tax=Streptacidiphilus anmyonensis TaxID=405782 RepID=UPI0005A83FC1|nr:methyltransferase domain-containing protein [Streptacidiphilus anmyonensis]
MQTADAQLLVLCALARGPLHGYAVNTAVGEVTGERLGRGSLSSALARLEAKGLIEPLERQGRQRPLRLTDAGRAALERELHATARVTQRMFEAAVPDRVAYQQRLSGVGALHAYRDVMARQLHPEPGGTVLDVGCGPGGDVPLLAAAVAGSGRVIGVDRDPRMPAEARARHGGRVPGVAFLRGDAHALPLASACVDRVWMHRVLQHAADPALVLAEAARVVRPGGRVVLAEPDWETLVFDHPDLEASRAYTRHVVDRVIRNGVVGRQLARRAAEAGLAVDAVVPVAAVLRDAGEADRILGFQRNAERAVAAGYLTAEAAQGWLDALAGGPFLASVTVHVVAATRG